MLETKSDDPAHPGDYRRHQLIAATIESIGVYGLSKTTIAKVAGHANLSQGIVNFYFKSKAELLLETLKSVSQEYTQAIERAFSSSDKPMEILESFISTSFDPGLCNTGKVAVWYAFWSETQARAEYLKLCSQDDEKFRDRLIEQICLLIKQHNTPAYNPVAIARGLEGLINDYWQEYLINPSGFDHGVAIQTCNDYILAFFPTEQKSNTSSSRDTPRQPESNETLAPWTYHNEEFLELEKAHIFKKHWLLVGHISDIPKQGDYLTFDAVGERALIIRSKNLDIQAFHNVCRHRGAKVVEAAQGNCPRALICPFHGWSYHLDGRIRHIPRKNTFPESIKKIEGLVKIPIEIWHGFIFINFTEGCESLANTMAPVEDIISPYMLDQLQPLPNTKYRQQRPYNWKIIHDIDNEGYHVPIGHPSLQQLYGNQYEDIIKQDIPVSYGYINDKPGKLWSVRHYKKILPEFEHLPEENQRLWLYTGIFPSMVIGLYPDMVEFYMSLPVTAESSEYIGAAYALPDSRREVKLSRYLTQRINQSTEQEDESFVRWIQKGIKSSAFPALQLSSLEHGVSHLHGKIQQLIPVSRLAKAPDPGKVAKRNESMSGIQGPLIP